MVKQHQRLENKRGFKMTKHETTITRIGCNICDSPKIFWADTADQFHLCKECHNKDTGVYD